MRCYAQRQVPGHGKTHGRIVAWFRAPSNRHPPFSAGGGAISKRTSLRGPACSRRYLGRGITSDARDLGLGASTNRLARWSDDAAPLDGANETKGLRMPTPEKPIEDAIVALTMDRAGLYGDPFFDSASCELDQMWQADLLADELTKLGYVVSVDEYTVSWEPPPDEYPRGKQPGPQGAFGDRRGSREELRFVQASDRLSGEADPAWLAVGNDAPRLRGDDRLSGRCGRT